ncbi:hypothetical protein AJ80_00227 [Polytolypa hystricis UAMH7299]|uniref:C2H2-type domain-containing protein n=1 Tax=Polytolypa hystricis (strain UAMH7299) TaxID=1447883 RepID=A0A2B7Z410_POLH7|nr:hypothetical protein AJ80_00227 [Polytolypa hystricis UAMH7299]
MANLRQEQQGELKEEKSSPTSHESLSPWGTLSDYYRANLGSPSPTHAGHPVMESYLAERSPEEPWTPIRAPNLDFQNITHALEAIETSPTTKTSEMQAMPSIRTALFLSDGPYEIAPDLAQKMPGHTPVPKFLGARHALLNVENAKFGKFGPDMLWPRARFDPPATAEDEKVDRDPWEYGQNNPRAFPSDDRISSIQFIPRAPYKSSRDRRKMSSVPKDSIQNLFEERRSAKDDISGSEMTAESSSEAEHQIMGIDGTGHRVLSPAKDEIVIHVMNELRNVFGPKWTACDTWYTRNEGSQAPHRDGEYSSNSTSSPHRTLNKTQSTNQAPKRSRSDKEAEDTNGDGVNKRPRKEELGVPVCQLDTAELKFACPFKKRSPARYPISKKNQACCHPGFPTIHRMKQHLYRRHPLSIHCQRCGTEFGQASELRTHATAPSGCDTRNVDFEGLSIYQEQEIRGQRERGGSEEDKWRSVYRVLFPQDHHVPSPYFEPEEWEDVSRFFHYTQQKLPRLVVAQVDNTIRQSNQQVEDVLRQLIQDAVQSYLEELYSSFRQTRGTSSGSPGANDQVVEGITANPPMSVRGPREASFDTPNPPILATPERYTAIVPNQSRGVQQVYDSTELT